VQLVLLHQGWQLFYVGIVLDCFESYASSADFLTESHMDFYTSILRPYQMQDEPDLRNFTV